MASSFNPRYGADYFFGHIAVVWAQRRDRSGCCLTGHVFDIYVKNTR